MSGGSPELAIHEGRRILAIRLGAPGSGDAVEHTIRHFLNPQEEWDRVEPRAALDPATVREAVDPAWKLDGFSTWSAAEQRRLNAPAWWKPPRIAVIERAHHAGYYPRYADLIRLAGRYLAPGSAWSQGVSPERIRAEVDGCLLAGNLLGTTSFQVVSAYRSVLIRATRAGTLGTLGDRLKARCQDLRARASSSQEPKP
jgi:hypothetical protein